MVQGCPQAGPTRRQDYEGRTRDRGDHVGKHIRNEQRRGTCPHSTETRLSGTLCAQFIDCSRAKRPTSSALHAFSLWLRDTETTSWKIDVLTNVIIGPREALFQQNKTYRRKNGNAITMRRTPLILDYYRLLRRAIASGGR